ncbi:Diacylglycerol acyltransferase/mycolyltransferase Ag85A precursor [Corynebacterium felinum]|nr:Diacylglycerol acyltransferase/mycolyltransferase Ag85A precursor [Corynebacterium felinum]
MGGCVSKKIRVGTHSLAGFQRLGVKNLVASVIVLSVLSLGVCAPAYAQRQELEPSSPRELSSLSSGSSRNPGNLRPRQGESSRQSSRESAQDASMLSSNARAALSNFGRGMSSQGMFSWGRVKDSVHFHELMRQLQRGSANTRISSDRLLHFIVSVIYALGLGRVIFPLPTPSPDQKPDTDISPDITSLQVVKKEKEGKYGDRVERWFISSPAMKRIVEVQVLLPKDSSQPAPQLYLLDGVDAPKDNGWLQTGEVIAHIGDDNVIGVLPTHALASFYADWNQPDPVLGYMKWETFLTTELPQVLEAGGHEGINPNGKRAIAGLSMGAGSAVRIAAKHPDVFHAAIGISGCYTTLDPVGRATHELTVHSRGGQVDHMWGPVGSADRNDNDVIERVEGLRNMPVYLSTADGYVTDDVMNEAAKYYWDGLGIGVVLEHGSMHCTKLLDRAMKSQGMDKKKVVYIEGGSHQWINFREQIKPGWEYVRPFLQ